MKKNIILIIDALYYYWKRIPTRFLWIKPAIFGLVSVIITSIANRVLNLPVNDITLEVIKVYVVNSILLPLSKQLENYTSDKVEEYE